MSEGIHGLVTGASAGLGEAYVRQLAQRCDSILVVARREERLSELAEELHPLCKVIPLCADLGSLEGQARVVEAIRQGPALDLLVNNAGFSTLGPFAHSDLDDEVAMLRLHHEATLALTRAALPAMLQRDRGTIINVASIGGLLGMPSVAVYGASKAFLVSFSRSLRTELQGSRLRVQCLCPGYTRTEIHSRDTFRDFDVSRVPDALWMDADTVVAESLAAVDAAQVGEIDPWLVVPGEHNRQIVLKAIDELRAAVTDDVALWDSGRG